MWYLVSIAVGVAVGWHFPQPQYAKNFEAWVASKLKSIGSIGK